MKQFLLKSNCTEPDLHSLAKAEAVPPEPVEASGQFQAAENGKEKEGQSENKSLPTKKNYFALAAVFLGLVFSISFLKNAVQGRLGYMFDAKQETIRTLQALKEKRLAKGYQNALVTIIVPPETKERKTRPAANPREIRKQVKLQANQYTVGYFGGISGLLLTVSNKSQHFINQVELEVSYLDRRGGVIGTDNYQVKYMQPHSCQVVSVPPSTKGVKVSCKVLSIYSKQDKPSLKQI